MSDEKRYADMRRASDLADARDAYFAAGGVESDIGARDDANWYWRRALKLNRRKLERLESEQRALWDQVGAAIVRCFPSLLPRPVPPAKPYNHTREDSPALPCPECASTAAERELSTMLVMVRADLDEARRVVASERTERAACPACLNNHAPEEPCRCPDCGRPAAPAGGFCGGANCEAPFRRSDVTRKRS